MTLAKQIKNVFQGELFTALTAIEATTTSAVIDCQGFNSIRIEEQILATSSSGWVATITGSETADGTFGALSKDVGVTITAVPASTSITAIGKYFRTISGCIPRFIKITETLGGGTGKITTKVTPFNI